nr:MAG TPA: hypothetical protein [Caudoviricetes sp.]
MIFKCSASIPVSVDSVSGNKVARESEQKFYS